MRIAFAAALCALGFGELSFANQSGQTQTSSAPVNSPAAQIAIAAVNNIEQVSSLEAVIKVRAYSDSSDATGLMEKYHIWSAGPRYRVFAEFPQQTEEKHRHLIGWSDGKRTYILQGFPPHEPRFIDFETGCGVHTVGNIYETTRDHWRLSVWRWRSLRRFRLGTVPSEPLRNLAAIMSGAIEAPSVSDIREGQREISFVLEGFTGPTGRMTCRGSRLIFTVDPQRNYLVTSVRSRLRNVDSGPYQELTSAASNRPSGPIDGFEHVTHESREIAPGIFAPTQVDFYICSGTKRTPVSRTSVEYVSVNEPIAPEELVFTFPKDCQVLERSGYEATPHRWHFAGDDGKFAATFTKLPDARQYYQEHVLPKLESYMLRRDVAPPGDDGADGLLPILSLGLAAVAAGVGAYWWRSRRSV